MGIRQSALCHQTVESHENLSGVRFKSLRMAHKHYKSCIFASHTYQCHVLLLLRILHP